MEIIARIVHISEVVLAIGDQAEIQKQRQQRRAMFTAPETRGPAIRELIYEAKMDTMHSLHGAGKCLHCMKCWTRAPGQQKQLVQWLHHVCSTSPGHFPAPHATHSLAAAEPSAIYCIKCWACSTSRHHALDMDYPERPPT